MDKRGKKLRVKSVLGFLFLCATLFSCGAEDPMALNEEQGAGKAEKEKYPWARELTVDKEETVKWEKIHVDDKLVMVLSIPEGQHAYRLTIENENYFERQARIDWGIGEVPEDNSFLTPTQKYNKCFPTSPEVGCAFYSEDDIQQQGLGVFEGPADLVITVNLISHHDWKFTALIEEVPQFTKGEQGTLLVGWIEAGVYLVDDPLHIPYYPELDRFPEEEEILQLESAALLFNSSSDAYIRGEGLRGYVPAGEALEVVSCDRGPIKLCQDMETLEPLKPCQLFDVIKCQVQVQ